MARKISSTQYRTFEFDRAAVNPDSRTLNLSFSSEAPVERYFGVEILDHAPESCDMSRLNNGAPLLFNHDTDRQIGVVESASIENRVGKATVRFSKCEYAEEIFRDVQDGIRRKVSVGYRLNDRKKVEVTEDGGKETYRFRNWQPFEISIVPIPADDSVGVSRSTPNETAEDFDLPEMKRNILLDPAPPAGGGGAPTIDLTKQERERVSGIRTLGKDNRNVNGIDEMVDDAIERGLTPEAFGMAVLAKLRDTRALPNADERIQPDGGAAATSTRTLGEEYIRSQAYKDKRTPSIIEVRGTLPQMLTRATLLSTGLTNIQKIPGVVLLDQNPLRVADLFSQGTTSSTTIRFTKESAFTNAATAVAEEGQKPEATFSLAETDVTVQKIAVVGRVSDEMFADYDYAMSYVNSRLLFMVAALEDNHLINGSGSGNQITGVLNVSGIQTQSYISNLGDTIHKAITKVASTPGFVGQPDALVIHPADWQNMVLTKDSAGQYYAGGPFLGPYGTGSVTRSGPWGLTPVITTAIAQGTAIVGAFKLGATLFRREGIRIETTNSDASDFVYNRIAIRAEERLALVPFRPTAFCKITGIPAVA